MSSRLKIIVPVGLVAIAATWFLTSPKDPSTETAQETSYQQQLAALRKKQDENARRSQSTTNESKAGSATIASTPGSSTQVDESHPSTVNANSSKNSPSSQMTQHIQNTLQSLQNMMPSGGLRTPVDNYDSNAQRLQYLQTMPLTVIESTGKPDAMAMARQDAGRMDPFGELPAAQPFPKQKTIPGSPTSLEKVAGSKGGSDFLSGPEGLPPPPSSSASLATDVPPPPPPPGIELDELPPPPEKPMLSKHLKLNAIIGDQIILAFKDRRYQKKNHFKQYITLSQGQEFDSVTLIDIGKDQATIAEHGRQITMQLDPIR